MVAQEYYILFAIVDLFSSKIGTLDFEKDFFLLRTKIVRLVVVAELVYFFKFQSLKLL